MGEGGGLLGMVSIRFLVARLVQALFVIVDSMGCMIYNRSRDNCHVIE